MTRKERLLLIEKFRMGQLEGIALQRFEQMLEEDPQLSKALELDQEMSEALDSHSDYNLFHKLVLEAEAKYFEPGVGKFWQPARIAAAVIFFLIAGSSIWWFGLRSPSPASIYERHFTPYTAPSNFRGTDLAQLDENFIMGLLKYEEADYEAAINYFLKATASDKTNYTAHFLTGVSYLALREFDPAESVLKNLANDSNHLFQDQSRWYLGLLYLTDEDKNNDDQAEVYFSRIETESLIKAAEKLRK